jgi:asparagine synthase (glutamine-hydrolysing)
MCGIVGILQPGLSVDEGHALVQTMTERLAHRGPDDAGVWYDDATGVGLGHRRLSIVDLSPLGHQPMVSASGRYHLTYNGDVYNFATLRQVLEPCGHRFRGTSDTEVILAAIEEWGLVAAVQRFVGMFAMAVWDSHTRTLHLVRDRMGIKPLFYGWAGAALVFGSELKALMAHPACARTIDRNALALLLRYNYIPAPSTIYQDIWKLPPGTILSIDERHRHTLPSPQPYWSVRDAVEQGQHDPFRGSAEEARDHLDALLRDAVACRMVADVPLGAFLSGGVDSSLVVALMQAQSSRPVRTFSIGFHEAAYNEAPYARAVAEHLGTDHTEMYVTPEEALAVIPRLPMLYDEPFSDSSQVPTFLLAALTRQHVTVSLSGDGGDELFGGYERYRVAQSLWQATGWLPTMGRYSLGRVMAVLPHQRLNTTLRWLAPMLPGSKQSGSVGDKLQRAAGILQTADRESLYRDLLSHWRTPTALVPGSRALPTLLTEREAWPALPDLNEWMMYIDMVTYLPDDILVKVDRATMGVNLEARVPLLDHRVVEFAWRLPLAMKLHEQRTKWLLRQVLYQYVPSALIERPKTGFGIPIDSWLRGPLRDWAEALLDESRLRKEGFFDPAPVRQKWHEHVAGVADRHYPLWDVLMFQAWQEQWL